MTTSTPTSGPAVNPLAQYLPTYEGGVPGLFDASAWEKAKAAGMTDEQIKEAMKLPGDAPWKITPETARDPNSAFGKAYALYQENLKQASRDYAQGVKGGRPVGGAKPPSAGSGTGAGAASGSGSGTGGSQPPAGSGNQPPSTQAQIEIDAIARERDRWKSEYEQLKDLGNRQRDMREDDSLARLRAGATIAGSNASRGSLQGGSAVAAGAGNRAGRILTAFGRTGGAAGGNRFAAAGRDRGASTGERNLASGVTGGGVSRYAIR